jgi:hypothetical protein
LTQNDPANILVIGDDIAAFGVFRRELWRIARQRHGNVDFVGTLRTGKHSTEETDPVVGLGSWLHSGKEGETHTQILQRIDALSSTLNPIAIVLQVGTKDISNNLENASTISAGILACVNALRGKFPVANILVGDPTRVFSPATDFAAKTTLAESLYPLIDSSVASLARVTYVPSGSLLTREGMNTGGTYPRAAGLELMANAFTRAIQNSIPPIFGQTIQRHSKLRPSAQTRIHVMRRFGQRVSVTGPAAGSGTPGNNGAIAFWYRPDAILTSPSATGDIIAYQEECFTLSAVAHKLFLITAPDIAGGQTVSSGDVLRAGEWHRIVIVFDNTNGVTCYVNGSIACAEALPTDAAWVYGDDFDIFLGYKDTTIASLPGAYADVVMAFDEIPTLKDIEKDYFDSDAAIPGTLGRWALTDGSLASTGSVASAASNTGALFDKRAPDFPLPGEPAYELDTIWSPDKDANITDWWRADMGLDPETAWFNQIATDTTKDFTPVTTDQGLPQSVLDPCGRTGLLFGKGNAAAATSPRIEVVSSTSLFNDIHNGNGGLVWVAFRTDGNDTGSKCLLSNHSSANTTIGFSLQVTQTSSLLAFVIGNGATTVVNSGLAGRTSNIEFMILRYKNDGSGSAIRMVSSQADISLAQSNAPSASNASGNLVMARHSTTTDNPFFGNILEAGFIRNSVKATLDTSITNLVTYLKNRYRIPAL